MPFAEAVARAGTLEVLLVALREGRILARATDLFMDGGSDRLLDRNIPSDWWNENTAHDIDPVAGRTRFTQDEDYFTYELLAIGIELERGPIDKQWPAKPKLPGRKSGAKRGTKQSPLWKPLLEHLDDIIKRGKISNPAEDAFGEARTWLEKEKWSLGDRALRVGLKRNRPKWFEA